MPEASATPTAADPLVSAAQKKRLVQLTAMASSLAMSRVEGDEDIYIGGIGSVMRLAGLAERNITHVLSVTLVEHREGLVGREHLAIEVQDEPEVDLLVHLPKAVRFINEALYPPSPRGSREESDDQPSNSSSTTTAAAAAEEVQRPTGAVIVHCSAGRSRSVSCVIAYLLWKHPETFGPAADDEPKQQTPTTSPSSSRPPGSGSQPVQRALAIIKQTRSFAEPNSGFMAQLERWWEMGCPDDVENHPAYHRWLYRREVDESVACGMAPTNLRFQDEEQQAASAAPEGGRNCELRCKKCRRVLANKPFILDHRRPMAWKAASSSLDDAEANCPHFFIEPLSWMRPTLELGELEGRLTCPGARCGASVGRYTWRGFRCSCNEWVTPAFSLQRSRVDEVVVDGGGGRGGGGGDGGQTGAAGIRLPPGMRRPVGGT